MTANNNPRLMDPLTYREREILGLLAKGLTNREIADRLYLSHETVKWHNKQIYSKLGVSNRTQAASRARQSGLLDGDGTSPAEASRRTDPRLPAPLTTLVGRERQIRELHQLVGEGTTRLVTLTGPGGIGKTRLAVAAVAELHDRFADGIYFIDLAPVRQPERVAEAIASALKLDSSAERSASDLLTGYLAKRHILLLIDNFEHVHDAAPMLVELLTAAPQLRVLVTSRELLEVYGETEYPVPPLSLPDLDQLGIAPLSSPSESIELFVERARAARPSFRINERNLGPVAEICVRLDGLPLAIELAAAMVKRSDPPELRKQLGRRIGKLEMGPRGVPERQRTLRSTISWSYELLEDEQKALFACLSVFQGGFTLGAAEQVAADRIPIGIQHGLQALINKNLLVQHGYSAEGRRYSMLQTIHEFAEQRLAEREDGEDFRLRHAEFFVELAERAEPKMRGPQQEYWYDRIEADYENIRTALGWALGGRHRRLGLRLVAAMRDYWSYQGPSLDGLHWIELALDNVEQVSSVLDARVYLTAAHRLLHMGDTDRAERLLGDSLAMFRQHGDRRNEAWALMMLSYALADQEGRYEEGLGRCDQAQSIFGELGDLAGVAQALTIRGELAYYQGDLELAEQSYREALALAQETGDQRRQSIQYTNLGMLEALRGNLAAAEQYYVEGLRLTRAIGFVHIAAYLVGALAEPLAQRGELAKAAALLGACAGIRERSGTLEEASTRPFLDEIIAGVKEQLGQEAFDSAFRDGRTMRVDAAMAYALDAAGQ